MELTPPLPAVAVRGRLLSKRGSYLTQYPQASLCKVQVLTGSDHASDSAGDAVARPERIPTFGAFEYDFSIEQESIKNVECRLAERRHVQDARIKAKESAALLKQEHENMLQQHKARKAAQQQREMELKAEKERENDRVIAEQAEIARRLLPPDQKTKIAEFQSVSGNNNFNEAKSFLTYFDWKLESALAAFFEYGGDLSRIPENLRSQESASPLTHIEFIFPDGRREVHDFKSSDTIWILFEFIFPQASLLSTRGFSLGVVSPARVFSEAEYDKSLEELGLVRSAEINVTPN